MTFLDKGTPTAAQTAGDCRKNVCNGNGETDPITDDSDLPANCPECTFAACDNGFPICPFSAFGTPCSDGGTCDGAGNCEP